MQMRFLVLFLFFCHAYVGGNERIIFQPRFIWADGSTTIQGTALFVKIPQDSVAALTSAHFIDFTGPRLLRVEWLDIHTGKVVATSTRCWGRPGKEGCYEPLDLRSDYLFAAATGKFPLENALELDNRTPDIGEEVWFPNKNPNTASGYDYVAGNVSESQNEFCIVILDQEIDLDSRSGTPVLSKKTGKVVGILTAGGNKEGKTLLYLAPSRSLWNALSEAKEFPKLEHVIGARE